MYWGVSSPIHVYRCCLSIITFRDYPINMCIPTTGDTSLVLVRRAHSAIIYPTLLSTLLAPLLNAPLCSAPPMIGRPGHGTSGAGTAASGRVSPAGGGGAARGRGAALGCDEAPRRERGEAEGGKATEGPRKTSGHGVLEGSQGQRAAEKAVQ